MVFIRLLTAMMLVLLIGCETVHYNFIPPVTTEGKQCVVQCASIREMCTANENQLAAYKQQSCDEREDHKYYVCMKSTTHNKDLQAKCDKKRNYCSQYPDTARCNQEYNQCFSNCGGTVQTIIEK